MKTIIKTAILFFVFASNVNAVVCESDSVPWNHRAFKDVAPYEIFDNGVDKLTDEMTELAFFAITQMYMTMAAEKIKALDYARVNAVSAALDYQLNEWEDRLYNASKIEGEIVNQRLEVSALLNEIQLGIVAIKSNEVIANEKKLLFP